MAGKTIKYKGFTIKVSPNPEDGDWIAELFKRGDTEGFMPSWGPTAAIALERAKAGADKVIAALKRGDMTRIAWSRRARTGRTLVWHCRNRNCGLWHHPIRSTTRPWCERCGRLLHPRDL